MSFLFNDTATTYIDTLSLHDALPIWNDDGRDVKNAGRLDGDPSSSLSATAYLGEVQAGREISSAGPKKNSGRSEEHTSELQSLTNLVCRLLLEKKKKKITQHNHKRNK